MPKERSKLEILAGVGFFVFVFVKFCMALIGLGMFLQARFG